MKTQLDASSRIMFEEAQKRGITCTIFGDAETILMEKDGHQWYTRGSRTSFQSSIGKTIADNKSLTKVFLDHYQLPTAQSVRVEKESELQQLTQLTFPLVMKPIDGRHGRGVVVGLQDQAAAEAAYQKVSGTTVIFEETLEGIEYRVMCVDYKCIAAAFRKPAHVVGDGHQTIAQLIEEKNQHPWRGKGHQFNLTLIEVDETVEKNLAEQSLTVDSIPDQGHEVRLRKTANLSTGGEAWDVTNEISDENKDLFAKIARAADLNTIGIDVMCQSLQTPIVSQPRAGIIEINASPGLRMHHYPIKGEAKNVAGAILDMVESRFS